MSLVIRIVSKEDSEYVCKEYFINFLPVESSTGIGLTELLIKELNKCGLEVGNIRGQGYDNGANMKGAHSGVQRRILNENPKAFFVPCSCHSVNLVVNDAAKQTGAGVICFLLKFDSKMECVKKTYLITNAKKCK